jgi:hypothetical protein
VSKGARQEAQSAAERGAAFNVALLEDGPERDAALIVHPLTTNGLHIITPTVESTYAHVNRVILNRLPGTNFVGDSRIGKSRTQFIIRKMLAVQHPTIPVGQILAKYHDRPTEAKFWDDISRDFKLVSTSARQTNAARDKIISAITTQCGVTNSSIYVLFADEVQCWGEGAWTHLRDLGNALESHGIVLIYLGFGHLSLQDEKNKLKAKKRRDLVGRFLKQLHPITGLENIEDLRKALQQLDDPKFDYPSRTGISCAEFFMPKAFAAGWRMQAETEYMWSAFDVMSRERIKIPAVNVGMQSVFLAIKHFLSSSRLDDSALFLGTSADWKKAVNDSDYEDDLC